MMEPQKVLDQNGDFEVWKIPGGNGKQIEVWINHKTKTYVISWIGEVDNDFINEAKSFIDKLKETYRLGDAGIQ